MDGPSGDLAHQRTFFGWGGVVGLTALCLCAAGCGDGAEAPDAATLPPVIADAAITAPPPDLGPLPDLTPPPIVDECADGDTQCSGYDRRTVCTPTPLGKKWVEEVCATGAGCVKGACEVAACADECSLGQTDAKGRTCQLVDVSTAATVTSDPATSLEDRARAYTMWLHRDSIVHGGVISAHYADPPTFSKVDIINVTGDSGFWTGTYLAAEALRLKSTGSVDARNKTRELVNTLHFWWNVSGSPGLLVRYVRPSGVPGELPTPDLDCATPARAAHCGVMYQGKSYDYIGHVSRDIYQGVLLGYFLAYEALGPSEEATRSLIRNDIAVFVEELMKVRDVNVNISYKGVNVTVPIKIPFAVLDPSEMKDGKLDMVFGDSVEDNNGLFGYQEFNPDLSTFVHQVPQLAFAPKIARSGVGIMLMSAFQIALAVMKDSPAMMARHDAVDDFYRNNLGLGGNVDDWLNIVELWDPGSYCASDYWGHDNNMEPFYNLLRLETDPGRSYTLREFVLTNQMWKPFFSTQKNSWFSFIYAANQPSHTKAEVDSAVAQLAQFPVPPRIDRTIDLRNDPMYPEDKACPGQLDHKQALDVAVRPYGNFVWEQDPWTLHKDADTAQGEPGIDYLAAYWMGRQHGFIPSSAPSKCLAYR